MRRLFEQLRNELRDTPRRWLVTGAAGFIGSSLVAELLDLGQDVVGLDNFSTGHRANLDDVFSSRSGLASRFRLIEGDIRDISACRASCVGVDYVLHQAALGSVPRSMADPIVSSEVNVDGFLNVLVAVRDANVKRMVFASSSSVYGTNRDLPQQEDRIGRPLSPYAATKVSNEIFAAAFQNAYGLETIGLRYFNVFGPRQDPNGPYAAAIPRWISGLITGDSCRIFGDGETSRDFCYIANAVQANLLAAAGATAEATNEVYNIACGQSTSLTCVFDAIREELAQYLPSVRQREPILEDFRRGDIRHSLASIEKARQRLGYEPTHDVSAGLRETLKWYAERLKV